MDAKTGILNLVILVSVCNAAILTGPKPLRVVPVHQNVTLICEVQIENHDTDSLMWKEYITVPTGKLIFDSKNPGSYTVEQTGFQILGEYNVFIRNADFTDGGLYSCEIVESGYNDLRMCDLVVVGVPQIEIKQQMYEGENATITCQVLYGSRDPSRIGDQGLDTPKLSMRIGSQDVEGSSYLEKGNLGDEDTYTPHRLIHTYNVTASAQMDMKNLTCNVTTDTPAFRHVGHRVLDVKYPVRNARIVNRNKEYVIGEKITCAADGNPTPTYTWKTVTPTIDPRVTPTPPRSGANLTVTLDMIGKSQDWTCTAENTDKSGVTVRKDTQIKFYAVEQKSPTGGSSNILFTVHTYILMLASLLLSYF